MATHSSIPAWKIPWTEEPGGPQATGPQRLSMTRKARPRAAEALTPSRKKQHTQPRAGTKSERLH